MYMITTADMYELPVFVGDTVKECADFLGIKSGAVFRKIKAIREDEEEIIKFKDYKAYKIDIKEEKDGI